MEQNELLFLGTCACDFSPRLSGDLKDTFDRNARRSSCALLNDRILIDCGTHAYDSLRISERDTSAITDILITHTHSDHFEPKNVEALAASRKDPLRLWVRNDAVVPAMRNVTVIRMDPYRTYTVAEGVTVTGLKANHDPSSAPQWLLVGANGKKLLYALDGAWFLCETYNYLKNAEADLYVADATVGDYDGDYRIAEHNSLPMLRTMIPSLRNQRILTENTKIFLSHLAPSLHKPHEEVCKTAHTFGAEVAYDGLTVIF